MYVKRKTAATPIMAGWIAGTPSLCRLLRSELYGVLGAACDQRRRDRRGQGFGTHPHKDMEILTYVLSGTVEHQDSMGNKEQIQAGEFQIMSAGTGVRHSEYNANQDRPLHLYQIWIIPDQVGLEPRYEQRMFDAPQGRQLVLSPDARDGSLKVFQDMTLSRWALNKGEQGEYPIAAGRRIWIQVVRGKVSVNGQAAGISDAFAVWDESALTIQADEESEILLFDLPPV